MNQKWDGPNPETGKTKREPPKTDGESKRILTRSFKPIRSIDSGKACALLRHGEPKREMGSGKPLDLHGRPKLCSKMRLKTV